jgi:hypothetical protein
MNITYKYILAGIDGDTNNETFLAGPGMPMQMPWMKVEELLKLRELVSSIQEIASQKEVRILCSRIDHIIDQVAE